MSLLPLPSRIAAAVIGAAAIGGVAYLAGDSAGANRVIARDAKANARAIAAIEKGRAAIDALNGRAAVAQTAQGTETRTIYRDAFRIVDRPVYHSLCLDRDGVGLLDRAAAAANIGITGELAGGAAATPALPAQ